jgi:hypothetical protein
MPKNRALIVASLALSGCLPNVVALEPKASAVQVVHEADKPLHCDVLGKISGSSRSDDEKAARAGAENDFRNHAAELKANFAFVEAERSGPVGTSGQHDVFMGGKALRCQTEAMEDAAEKAAASEREERADADSEPAAGADKASKPQPHAKK